MIKVLSATLVIFAVGVYGDCDKSKCPPIPIHYEEIGCKPVLNDGDCCPKSFDCSHLDTRSDKKCYYKGMAYEPRSIIDREVFKGTCIGAVHCSEQAQFYYAHLDCAEFFGPPLPSDCVRQYSCDKCCSTGEICGEEAQKLKTCEFEGKTYKTGERIFLGCHTCYCTDDFNGNLAVDENPNCKKVNCNIELFKVDEIKRKCAPVYHKDSYCPSVWRCPSDEDAVAAGAQNSSGPKCKFGKLELSIGDSLATGDNSCQKCTCTQPPFLSCSFVDC